MTTAHNMAELDSGAAATDAFASSPNSDHHNQRTHEDAPPPRARFMCSFGGKILPRPHDNQLRYVGGDTRIITVHRHATTFRSLLDKLSKFAGTNHISVKYQLLSEDLDALITVTTDEDVENMMDEYDRLAHNQKTARLRLFLFSTEADSRNSSISSISSILNGSAKREHWFFDALNGGSGPDSALERGRSEVSSIMSEVPDYLFGLDTSDDPTPREGKLKNRSISGRDTSSPGPVLSSPFCSMSSVSGAATFVPSVPDLRPVKTRPINPTPVPEWKEPTVEKVVETDDPTDVEQIGYSGKPMVHYIPDPHFPGPAVQNMPVYYLPGSVPPPNVPLQHVPVRAPYVHSYPTHPGQIPVGYHQQAPGMGQVYRQIQGVDPSGRLVTDGMNQQLYYEVRNPGVMPHYQGMVAPGGAEEMQGMGPEGKVGRVSWSS
ncbi:hypothetical protein RJ640_017613 [Escallonia rubra]|uniref:PB1 domain-containing protein n=1 Tax=Escallonia rubra TaxID=112253 RepID=A0AA88QU43_9ASTE|nr:hypothetical protein RJ640_017613 [Escallonia rubra]